MEYTEGENIICMRFVDGEDLIALLRETASEKGLPSCVILSAAGMLRNFEVAYYVGNSQYEKKKVEEGCEVVSFTGSLSYHEKEPIFHIHSTLAFRNNDVLGGHLSQGTVHNTFELFLLKLKDIDLIRTLDEKTGLLLMSPSRK